MGPVYSVVPGKISHVQINNIEMISNINWTHVCRRHSGNHQEIKPDTGSLWHFGPTLYKVINEKGQKEKKTVA